MSQKLALSAVKELAEGLSPTHGRGGIVCPFCEGGSSKEKTFSLLRTIDGIRYICHRASCGAKGFVLTDLSHASCSAVSPPKKEDKTKHLSFQPLSSELYEHLIAKYHLTAMEIQRAGIKWSPTISRVILPISTNRGMRVGFTARSEDPKIKPKALTYVTSPELPLGAYYLSVAGKRDTLWLVEDQISALRLSLHHNAVALLGTHLSDSLLADIKSCGIKNLVVCLDADASAVSMRLTNSIGGLFTNVAVRFPSKDLKNMTPEELKEFVL